MDEVRRSREEVKETEEKIKANALMLHHRPPPENPPGSPAFLNYDDAMDIVFFLYGNTMDIVYTPRCVRAILVQKPC